MTSPRIKDEGDELSKLIGDVYDAALDPSGWPDALLKARKFVRGAAATVFSKDAVEKSGGVYFDDGGLPAEYVELYFNKYVKFDPATTRHFFSKLGESYATADLMDYDEFVESRFFQEWAKPQGLVDFVASVLDKSTTGVTMFGVFRHERDGVVDGETRRRMGLISPHVRRAILIGRVIELKSAREASFTDTLDALSAGMFLVDAGSRIVHANASGLAMLAVADFLHETDGRLEAGEPETKESLREIVAAAVGGDAAIGVRGIAVPLKARDGTRYVAHVLPLTSGERRQAGRSYSAVAAVFVHRAALDTPSPPEIIAKAYKLTPTELRVLLAIVEIGGAPEVAEALGVGETTVKTHLGRLYEKTGARRHADLVKLVAGFANPLIG